MYTAKYTLKYPLTFKNLANQQQSHSNTDVILSAMSAHSHSRKNSAPCHSDWCGMSMSQWLSSDFNSIHRDAEDFPLVDHAGRPIHVICVASGDGVVHQLLTSSRPPRVLPVLDCTPHTVVQRAHVLARNGTEQHDEPMSIRWMGPRLINGVLSSIRAVDDHP